MLPNFQYNIENFHPALRDGMLKEFHRIEAETPPIIGRIRISVRDRVIVSSECPCGKCDGRDILKSAFAATSSRVYDTRDSFRSHIVFSSRYYGVDGDPEELIKGIDQEYRNTGGLVNDPYAVVTHEYGHAFDAMIKARYGRLPDEKYPTNETARIYDSMDAFFNEEYHDRQHEIRIMGAIFRLKVFFDRESDPMPSLYSYHSPQEAFAESFAAVYKGDKRQKSLPIVMRTKAVIDTAYKELNHVTLANQINRKSDGS